MSYFFWFGAVLGIWAILRVLGNERQRELYHLQNRMRVESERRAEAAREAAEYASTATVVGSPRS